ncbi:SAC3 family protein C isoform X2 [Rosa rugosa]|uniref:SAC3 family protein C isoform X2 n=1 Tax=Rosa rugosa TaxID=74645 RepID=UPI002B40235F|nr:SAC3 family protein C isoform X2 [Rosa rugosa]
MERRGRRNRSSSSSRGSRSWSRGGTSSAEKVENVAVSDVPPIVGTCTLMCPEAERAQRERLRDLATFERLNGNPARSSPSIAVKKVKFHIISLHKLRGCSSQNTSPMHHLNLEQLAKTLTSLFNLYGANRHSNSTYENEAEFCSFYVLLHLGSHSQPLGESLSWWFSHVPSSIIKSKEMHFSRKILRYFRMGNYKRFLSTVAAEASYLQYCIIEPYVDEVRVLAVSCINSGGYKLHPYPLSHLSKLLIMKESDLESFLKSCGLQICTDEGHNLLPTKQTTFCHPKDGSQNYRFWGMEQFER